MKLSPIGIIADILWYEIKNHCRNIELGEFVIMPNHIHRILILNGVETGHALSLHFRPLLQNKIIGKNRFQNIGKNTISSIVGSYKSAVMKHAHRLGYYFEWQTRFYDHIIRNEKSYKKIAEYIINNPLNWENDKYYNT